jgi:hypothetical protein
MVLGVVGYRGEVGAELGEVLVFEMAFEGGAPEGIGVAAHDLEDLRRRFRVGTS